jgi:predicted Zn-dependent peptidase
LRENAAWISPLLAVQCSFEKWDVRDAIASANKESEEAKSNAQVALTDSIYAAAYGAQSCLGRSYYTPSASRPSIISFRERTYTLNGAILAATGIADHEAFVRMVEDEFPKAASPKVEKAETAYMAGESRLDAPSTGYTHVALAFSGPTSTPLSNVLKHALSLSGASAFASPGLFGVYGGSAPSDAETTIDALSKAITTTPSADVISNAKAAAKAEALAALASGSKSLADAMTASIIDSCTFSPAALAQSYDAVSEADVKKALDDMKKGGVSLAAVGDLSSVPYRASVAGRFN